MGGSSRKVLFKITSFAIHSSFLLPSFFRREEKRGVEKIHHEKIGPKKAEIVHLILLDFMRPKNVCLQFLQKRPKSALFTKQLFIKL